MLGGLYRGVLVELEAPPSARIKVRVPSVLGSQAVWAEACSPFPIMEMMYMIFGKFMDIEEGGFFTSNIGVWVMFEGGDRALPVWVGFTSMMFGEEFAGKFN